MAKESTRYDESGVPRHEVLSTDAKYSARRTASNLMDFLRRYLPCSSRSGRSRTALIDQERTVKEFLDRGRSNRRWFRLFEVHTSIINPSFRTLPVPSSIIIRRVRTWRLGLLRRVRSGTHCEWGRQRAEYRDNVAVAEPCRLGGLDWQGSSEAA